MTDLDPVSLAFDKQSEVISPYSLVLDLDTSTLLTATASDLTGPNGAIPAAKVRVRILPPRILLTVGLRDNPPSSTGSDVPPVGVYSGKVTFTRSNGDDLVLPIHATCTDGLWWGP